MLYPELPDGSCFRAQVLHGGGDGGRPHHPGAPRHPSSSELVFIFGWKREVEIGINSQPLRGSRTGPARHSPPPVSSQKCGTCADHRRWGACRGTPAVNRLRLGVELWRRKAKCTCLRPAPLRGSVGLVEPSLMVSAAGLSLLITGAVLRARVVAGVRSDVASPIASFVGVEGVERLRSARG